MLSTITFLVLLSVGHIQAIPIADESCDVQIYHQPTPCDGSLVVPYSCESATANLTGTRFESCDTIHFTWAYPLNNLTIIIATTYTQQRQPYAINIDNGFFKVYPLPIYRILDGQETEITTTDDVIVQKSDSNYEVILKFQAQTTVSYYISHIYYNVTQV